MLSDNSDKDTPIERATRQLFELVCLPECGLEAIRAAVRAGANVNAVDHVGESVLVNAICTYGEREVSLDVIRLLIELGADVNAVDEDGMGALFSAIITCDSSVVELLLKLGADPNGIIERHESILDMAQCDLGIRRYDLESHPNSEWDVRRTAELHKIVGLLEAAGAKSIYDMQAIRASDWIFVHGSYPTGLMTCGGKLNCESLPGATESFCRRFAAWNDSHFDTFPNKTLADMPEEFDRREHNAEGRALAEQIERMVCPDMILCSINTESESKGVRTVDHVRIQARSEVD